MGAVPRFVIASKSIHSEKFKHHKYSKNVNFEETSNIVSNLGSLVKLQGKEPKQEQTLQGLIGGIQKLGVVGGKKTKGYFE